MQRLPWLVFDNRLSGDLEKIFLNAIVQIKDDSALSDGSGSTLYITVIDLTNLGGAIATIDDLLTATTQWSYMFSGSGEKGGVLYDTATSYVPGDTISIVDATLPAPLNAEMRTYTCVAATTGAWNSTDWNDLESGGEDVWPSSIVSSADPFGDGSLIYKALFDGDTNAIVGNNGTPNNITYTAGQFGDAAVFNGSARDGIAAGLNVGNVFTYSFCIYPTFSSTTAKYVVDFSTGGNIVATGNAANHNMWVYTGSTWVDCGFEPMLNGWTHIVLTSNGTTFEVFEDKVSRFISVDAMSSASGEWGIGAAGTANVSNWKGRIDQFEIYNKVVSQTEIDALHIQEF